MGVTETLQHLQKKYSKDVAMRTTLSRTGHGGRAKSTESYFALLNHPHPINNVHYYRLEQRPVPTHLPHCCERAKGIDPYGKGRNRSNKFAISAIFNGRRLSSWCKGGDRGGEGTTQLRLIEFFLPKDLAKGYPPPLPTLLAKSRS